MNLHAVNLECGGFRWFRHSNWILCNDFIFFVVIEKKSFRMSKVNNKMGRLGAVFINAVLVFLDVGTRYLLLGIGTYYTVGA